ncbi:MAG: RidA family protein [Planctomycetota bacterium]
MKQATEMELISGASVYQNGSVDTATTLSRKQEPPTLDRRPLHVPQAMCEAYHYSKPSAFSRGTEVDLGVARLIFLSGTASVGPKGETLHAWDFRAQAWQAFENARAVLNAADADWHDVVKVTIFLKDIATYYPSLNEVRCAYFKKIGLDIYPASTCVEAKLCREKLLVEMELIAVVRNAS